MPPILAPVIMGTMAVFGFGRLHTAFTEGWIEGYSRHGPEPVYVVSNSPILFLFFTLFWAISSLGSACLAIYAIYGMVQDMRADTDTTPKL
jgi:hypothetical protein